MDATHLVDLLREENIVTDFRAAAVEDAIAQLVELMVRSGSLAEELSEPLLESALRREREASTCFGNGLAVPHGTLPEASELRAAMGLSAEGLAFPTPDGRPVHCVVLLATPPDGRDEHLRVLSLLAGVIGLDTDRATRLYASDSPAGARLALRSPTP